MRLDDSDLERLARCLNGVPILGCPWGSVAALLGLERGDVVVAVNGVKTPDALSFNYARSLRDDQLELEIIRNGVALRFFIGREKLRGFDPMFVLDELLASQFDLIA